MCKIISVKFLHRKFGDVRQNIRAHSPCSGRCHASGQFNGWRNYDLDIFEHLNIDVRKKSVLGLKVKNHFLAAFKPVIERTIYVDVPGVSTNDFTQLPYKNVNRPIWSLDDIINWRN